MTKNRDDFPNSVKIELAGRVGWICSFPNCGQSTSGPSHDSPEKMIKNGIAAHITAAAPGGPRYDATLTTEQRRSIENGIWMCPHHGSLIDKDSAYSTAEIKGWKSDAENNARRNLEYGPGFQMKSPYSPKDLKILEAYSGIFTWVVIERIRGELFGRTVSHDVTNPLDAALGMEKNPAYTFQNASLESLRQTLNSRIWSFYRHFSQQSAGNIGHYDYIDIHECVRRAPEHEQHWKNQIYKTQELAGLICETALELLTIKENNCFNLASQ
ncbi:TPA: hypothetical protein OTX76_002035 [Pseudomonas aeruginosa]|nr:hypothetical protein [Pseudomonas aeruginosa]HCU2375068.1 hypothetical protein [Pseudomonas aeruginosa]